MKTKLISMAVLGLGLVAGAAQAAPTTVYGLSTAPGGAVVGDAAAALNTFSGALKTGSQLTDGVSGTPGLVNSVSLGAIGGSLTSAALPPNTDVSFGPGIFTTNLAIGRFDTSGNGQFWETATSFTVTFQKSVKAFGFFVTDAGDFNGDFSIELVRDGGGVETIDLVALASADPGSTNDPGSVRNNDANNGWLEFFGFYDAINSYSEVRFNILQGTDQPNDWDYLGFDSFTVGDVPAPNNDVPEPGSLALVGASLLGLAAARRRKPRA